MENGLFTMIRRDQDGLDIRLYVDFYELPKKYMEDDNDAEALELFRRIAKDYLKTDAGKDELSYNCGCFNWNDFVNIPEEFLSSYGVRNVSTNSYLISKVDANEDLT